MSCPCSSFEKRSPIILTSWSIVCITCLILLVSSFSFVAKDGKAEIDSLSQSLEYPNQPAADDGDSATCTTGLQQGLKVVLVLDPNFYLCWERVAIDDFTRHTLLAWVAQLRDSLTMTAGNPLGDFLQFENKTGPYPRLPEDIFTFNDLITRALAEKQTSVMLPSNLITAYQLSLVESSGTQSDGKGQMLIGATSVANFWRTVAHASRYGKLIAKGKDSIAPAGRQDEVLREAINGAVFLLPRIVPQIHSYGGLVRVPAKGRALHAAELTRMVGLFLGVAGATSVPSLKEYGVLPDKIKLTEMYRSFYMDHPADRASPIPTAHVKLPASEDDLLDLCYATDVQPAAWFKEVAASAIYEAMVELEAQIAAHPKAATLQAATRTGQGKTGVGLRKYFIKREYAEGSKRLTTFVFPTALLDDQNTRLAPHLARPPIAHEASHAEDNATPTPYLEKAAAFIISQSCGEGWLLQPEIPGMADLEYRVYLPGGAQAAKEDAIVVYTPSVIREESGRFNIYMANFTVPPGHFFSDAMRPQGDNDVTSSTELSLNSKIYQERIAWRAPKLYDAIVDAARCAAKAMASYRPVALSSVAEVFVRVDVVLAAVQSVEDGAPLVLINEMDWFNSAAHMTHSWTDTTGLPWDGGRLQATSQNGLLQSSGFKLAQHLSKLIWEQSRMMSRLGNS